MRADKTDAKPRVLGFQRFSDSRVGGKGRRACVDDDQVVVMRQWQNVGELKATRGRIDEPASWNERRRLREPCGVPKGPNLARGLIAGPGTAIKSFIRGWIEE